MIMKVLLALMKDGRDQAFLMVIDYLIKENKTIRDKYSDGPGEPLLGLWAYCRPDIEPALRGVRRDRQEGSV